MATYRAADSQTITSTETDIFVASTALDTNGAKGTNGPPVFSFGFKVVSGIALVRVYPSGAAEQITLTSADGWVPLGEYSNKMGVTRLTVQGGASASCVVSWYPIAS